MRQTAILCQLQFKRRKKRKIWVWEWLRRRETLEEHNTIASGFQLQDRYCNNSFWFCIIFTFFNLYALSFLGLFC